MSVPFAAGTSGYHIYRIPALASTLSGVLVALCEARKSGAADDGDIDIVCRRSTDGGLTWGAQQLVTSHGTDTAGNPAVVVDPASGDVVLLSCRHASTVTEQQIMQGTGERRVYVQRSSDDGTSWASPTEITSRVRPSWMRWYATGPGAGVALTQGAHAGRLVIPCNHSRTPNGGDSGAEEKYYGGHAIVSDDGGTNWALGFTSSAPNGDINENENTAAELPDGRLYFNCRNQNGKQPGTRADAYSLDGGQTLQMSYRAQACITTPVVQGALLALPDGRLLYSGPTHPAQRAAMGLWASEDEGVSWELRRRVSGLPAAYSSLALLDGGATVGLLYETGDWGPYKRVEFARIPLADV